ncbi:hypothetical protein CRG98_033858 [Punica granatum]|uniref:Reverse transcriptase Ty1/copia-type domain-containing protein n=1 Tax=Punica granatum TaxID=22663 RepID=A0A2I0INZ2_PUNGR|nr:hypothetical protein CRG98_033858 [Punica granatum]
MYPIRTHTIVTRSQNGIYKPNPRYANVAISSIPLEPHSVKSASKDPEWTKAMLEELDALKHNTWEVVPPQPEMNVVGYKWIFKTKIRADGSLDRLKARLVKGLSS